MIADFIVYGCNLLPNLVIKNNVLPHGDILIAQMQLLFTFGNEVTTFYKGLAASFLLFCF